LHIDYSSISTGFFKYSDFIFVLQTGSGFLPLGTGLESDLKNLSPNTSGLGQVFPNFLWLCTPSAFRYMSMYP